MAKAAAAKPLKSTKSNEKSVTVTKTDLVRMIAGNMGTTIVAATEFLNAFQSTVTENLSKGNSIGITGFMSMKVRKRPARTGRNPRTGQTLQIAARKAVSFSAGKSLKDEVNS